MANTKRRAINDDHSEAGTATSHSTYGTTNYNADQRLLHEVLIYWGYQRRDIEHLCNQKALDPVSFAERLGELWIQNTRERDSEGMPGVSTGGDHVAVRRGRAAASASHGDHGAHDDRPLRTSNKKSATPSKAAKGQVRRTAKEEAEILDGMIRKMRKRSDPMAKKVLKGLLRRKRGLPPKSSKLSGDRYQRQLIYAKRARERAKGVSEKQLTPLPEAA